MKTLYISIAIIGSQLATALAPATAATVTIPNTFQAGTPAKAAEVNANFSAVGNAINDTAAAVSTLQSSAVPVVKVAGTSVGRVLSFSPTFYQYVAAGNLVFSTEPIDSRSSSNVTVITSKGYVATVTLNPESGFPFVPAPSEGSPIVTSFIFDQPGCQGTKYALVGNVPTSTTQRVANISSWVLRAGEILGSPDPSDATPIYYIPAGSAAIALTTQSIQQRNYVSADGATVPTEGTTCINTTLPPSLLGVQVLPNNPAVTGYPAVSAGAVTIR